MMKQLCIFLFVPLFLISSCIKTKKLNYTISARYDSADARDNRVVVSTTKTGGDDDFVSLSVEGVPDYLIAEISQPSEKPPFNASITFKLTTFGELHARNWTNYTATIKAISRAGLTKKVDVTFPYTPRNPAAAFDLVTFYYTRSCTMTGHVNDLTLVYNPSPNRIVIGRLYSTMIADYDVPATLDPMTRKITMEPYTIDGFTFRGTGSFYPIDGTDSIGFTLSYSRSTISTFDSCTATFNQFD